MRRHTVAYADRMSSADIFAIDPGSSTAPFRQLHECVIAALAQGELQPGAQLPTVRGLATHLGIAANTVAAAYRSLEAAGVVEGRGRSGTFVRLGDNPVEAEARRLLLEAVSSLGALGVSHERAAELFREALDAAPGA